MKKRFFLFAALILSLSVGTINATSEVQEIVMTNLSVDNMSEARAFLANYYVTTESDVALSNHPSTSGYPAYRYNIMSQDVSGTIYGSSTGFIVEEDIDGL